MFSERMSSARAVHCTVLPDMVLLLWILLSKGFHLGLGKQFSRSDVLPASISTQVQSLEPT